MKKKPSRPSSDPGPHATPELAFKAKAEARALLKVIRSLNLEYAAEHVRQNPPSPEAIAMLGFYAYELFTSARAKWNAGLPRHTTRTERLRRLGVKNYVHLCEMAEEDDDAHVLLTEEGATKRNLTDAISKVNRRKKAPSRFGDSLARNSNTPTVAYLRLCLTESDPCN